MSNAKQQTVGTMMCPFIRQWVVGYWVVILGGAVVDSAPAAEVVSSPAGFYRMDLLGNSDTIVSLPFTRPVAASGLVEAAADNVVTVTGHTDWTVNQFVYAAGSQSNTYFAQVSSGTKEGFCYPVLGNTANTLTLNLRGDTLTGLAAGDRVAIIPYWTLGTVFPGGQGVHASSSPLIRKTEVLIPNLAGTGVNLSSTKTYYYMEGNWKQTGDTLPKDDDVLWPDAYFTVRHKIATATTLTVRGSVVTTKWAIPLRTNPSAQQDNVVALPRPTATTLGASGLIEAGVFRPSPSPLVRLDQLFIFDNTQVAWNKSSAGTYYYYNNQWRRVGQVEDVSNNAVFTPGTGVIIRKGPAADQLIWTNSVTY